jgi:ATP-dependent DNA ligase
MAFQRRKPAAIGIKAEYPGFIEPELATSVDKVPSGKRWIHEVKFDGYGVQVHLRDAAVKVFTRRGNDWTNRFKKVAADAWHINAGSAIVDGEVVVPAGAAQAADPQDAALQQEDRAQRHLGRTVAAGRDRISGEVRRGQGAPSVL